MRAVGSAPPADFASKARVSDAISEISRRRHCDRGRFGRGAARDRNPGWLADRRHPEPDRAPNRLPAGNRDDQHPSAAQSDHCADRHLADRRPQPREQHRAHGCQRPSPNLARKSAARQTSCRRVDRNAAGNTRADASPALATARRLSSGAPGKTPKTDALLSVSHVAVADGTIVMSDKQRGFENRLDNVRLDATIDADRNMKVAFDAIASGKPIGLEASATVPQGSLADVTIPVDFKLKVPAILTEQLSASAQLKFDGSTILIDALRGDLDGAGFKGNASVELVSKPQVKVNLDLTPNQYRQGRYRRFRKRCYVSGTGGCAAALERPALRSSWPELYRRADASLDRRTQCRHDQDCSTAGRCQHRGRYRARHRLEDRYL